MFNYQSIELPPAEKSNQLTKKTCTTYHKLVLLRVVYRMHDLLYGAPPRAHFQSVFPKTVLGQECIQIFEHNCSSFT